MSAMSVHRRPFVHAVAAASSCIASGELPPSISAGQTLVTTRRGAILGRGSSRRAALRCEHHKVIAVLPKPGVQEQADAGGRLGCPEQFLEAEANGVLLAVEVRFKDHPLASRSE